MIHEIARELEAQLQTTGCPFKVYEREPTQPTTWARNRIVIEHDATGDTLTSPRTTMRNPRSHYTRTIGAKITIYAQSVKSGANEFEHRRLCETALDFVLIAMRNVAATRLNGYAPGRGKFVRIVDLDKSEVQGGAVYELPFTFERAVTERTWAGAIAAEATLSSGSITSGTRVSLTGGPDNDDNPNTVPTAAELACGV